MMTQLLTAQPIVDAQLSLLQNKCQSWHKQNIFPHLHVVQVGNNQSSNRYISRKKEFCEKIGAQFSLKQFPESISEIEFKDHLKKINEDSKIHGALIQLPVSENLKNLSLAELINANKDVDGFHPQNVYNLYSGKSLNETIIPCTPKGILSILNHYKVEIKGKNILVIGRSLIVGKPLLLLLSNEGATVTLAHSLTKNLSAIAKSADIIISAIGKAEFIDSNFVKTDQTIIDVGINQLPNGKLVGDVNFNAISTSVRAITPVPGGVGPMTVLSLMENLFQCLEIQMKGK